MAPKKTKNKTKTVIGKSKLIILAYKPEVQQASLNFVYETKHLCGTCAYLQ